MTKIRYRSDLERRVCNNLRNRRVKFEYEPFQLAYTTEVRNAICPACGSKGMLKERQYTPDLSLNGGNTLIEIKGRFTGEMRTKMTAVKRCNPEFEIKMLFQRDGWCTKRQKMRYSEWCEKNGFDYAIGEVVPSEWIN